MSNLYVYTDGGARGNPGPAALGVVIKDANQEVVTTLKRFIGNQTNNYAEYAALLEACTWLESHKPIQTKLIKFYLDSELVVKQLNGEYKIKQPQLALLANQIIQILKKLQAEVEIVHISRDLNKEADALVNISLDIYAKTGI